MTTLTLAQARTLIDGALAAARAAGFKPMGVVVVDAAAQVVASAREDGASAVDECVRRRLAPRRHREYPFGKGNCAV